MTIAQSSLVSRRGVLPMLPQLGYLGRDWWLAKPKDMIRSEAAKAPITVHRLRGNVSVLEGSGGNIAVLTGSDGSLLVDAGYYCLAAPHR